MNVYSTENLKEKVFSHVRGTLLRTFHNAGVFMTGSVDVDDVKKSKLYFVIEPLPTTGRNDVRCEVTAFLVVKKNRLDTSFLSDIMTNLEIAFRDVTDIVLVLSSIRMEEVCIDGFSKMGFVLSVSTTTIKKQK